MSSKLVIVPNNMRSQSAKELAKKLSEKLGYRVWRVHHRNIRKRRAFILYAGTDKLSQFQLFKKYEVASPEFTTSKEVAEKWCAEGETVVARTLLRSSEGKGIYFAKVPEDLVDAPLYTKYMKKKKEFRVHVLWNQVIDVQEKRKKRSFDDDRDTRIRNLANGYVFCRGDIQEPDGLRDLALSATKALDYTLGAVDIIYNSNQKRLVVLEVNANPGLMGETLENYANAILKGM